MKSSLKFIIYIIVGFTFLMIGLETFRIFMIDLRIDDRVQTIAEDAIELAMIDKYRKNHISYIDASKSERLFYEFIKQDFNLNSNLEPNDNYSMFGKFFIKYSEFYEGSFEIKDGKTYQISRPYIKIKGYTTIKPMVLNFNKRIPIYFDLYIENKRYD